MVRKINIDILQNAKHFGEFLILEAAFKEFSGKKFYGKFHKNPC